MATKRQAKRLDAPAEVKPTKTEPVDYEPEKLHPVARHQLTSRHWQWAMPLAGVVLGLAVGGGILLTVQAQWTADDAARHRVAPYGRILESKALAESDIYRMSVTSNVTTINNDPAFTPAEGQNLVVFAISVTNKSQQVQPFLPVVHTYLRDDEGGMYPMHPSVGVTNPLPATDLKPGETVSGQLSYAVPAKLKDFRLFIDPEWQGMTPVVFHLSR